MYQTSYYVIWTLSAVSFHLHIHYILLLNNFIWMTDVTASVYLISMFCSCSTLSHLKSDYHFPKKCFICFNETPLKMIKNAFYLILKVLFVLKIFKLLSFWLNTFWSFRRNDLIRKRRLISRFLTSQPS